MDNCVIVTGGAGTMAIQSGQNVALRKPLKNESSRKVDNLAHAILRSTDKDVTDFTTKMTKLTLLTVLSIYAPPTPLRTDKGE